MKIVSYINNLWANMSNATRQPVLTLSRFIRHPEREAAFYPIIAKLFERFVPMFERVLSDCQVPPPRRIEVKSDDAYNWYGEDSSFDYDNYSGSDEDEAQERWEESRAITLPAPKAPFSLPPLPTGDEVPAFQLRGRTVQVIVKLANIQLSPTKPDYEGGVWHVEGMANESIVSSGIYYYDEENIGESRLEFRGSFDVRGSLLSAADRNVADFDPRSIQEEELPYEQCDYRGVRTVFGIENEGPVVQEYGSLVTKGGRAITFPNLYQVRSTAHSFGGQHANSAPYPLSTEYAPSP